MAGKNIILEPNQVLFKSGDTSDGMYLIRSGELRVYLDDNGKEVSLATVAGGGMIGEMALFDKKPRSASVKAISKSEVTLISNEDFAKLMKQIPKWFVSLMGTLSGRLRDTNERLQKIEGGPKEVPFQTTTKILHMIAMLWHKDGEKQGKIWQIDKRMVVEAIEAMFKDDASKLNDLLQVLVNHKLLSTTKNSYNAIVLTMPNKGTLTLFTEFLTEYVSKNEKQACLSDAALEVLEALNVYAAKSAYETFSIDLEELQNEGRKLDMKHVEDWKTVLPQFKTLGDEVKLVKTGSGGGIGFRTNKKGLGTSLVYHKVISSMYKANLS